MYKKIPVTLCLFTSTKGHFERTDIYKKTAASILKQLPAGNWYELVANIKEGSVEKEKGDEMETQLKTLGFHVTRKLGDWKHSDDSHQIGFLGDQISVISNVKSPYIFFLEDDWLINTYDDSELIEWIHRATVMLENDPSLLQVRIPRFFNETDRIRGLKEKHGIYGLVQTIDNYHFRHNDWSNNPYIARTRDINAALRILFASSLPKHSEHGTSATVKLLSSSITPFACFHADKIRCSHIGTPIGQEDDPNKPLIAN